MSDTNLQEYMAEIMSAEYRQVIDNMLLSSEPGAFRTWLSPYHLTAHNVEVEFDGN